MDVIRKPDEEQKPEEQVIELQVRDVRVNLEGVNLSVAPIPDTEAKALVIGPVMMTFVLPLDKEGARSVARHLVGGVEIATRMDIPKGKPR
jgi:hypothetical protein